MSKKSGNKKFISIIFSFRNEEEVLEALLTRTVKAIESVKCDYEVIFVNDFSTDGSEAILRNWHKKNKNIKIINLSRNFSGYECHFAGFDYASGDAIIYLDSDLQDPPELIPLMIRTWEETGVDVVKTVRTSRAGESALRLFFVKWGYRIINFGAYFKITENSGDYRLISRKVKNAILMLSEHDPFLRALTVWHGYPSTVVYYDREERVAGKSVFGLSNPKVWIFFLYMYTSFSILPILLMIFLGTISSIFSFLAILFLFLFGIFQNNISAIYPAVLMLGFSILLASIGMVGFYVHRVHRQVIDRPKYIVADTVGF